MAEIDRDLQDKLEVKPVEFRPAVDNVGFKRMLDQAEKDLTKLISNSEKQVGDAGDKYKKTLGKEVDAKAQAGKRKQFLQDQTFRLASSLASLRWSSENGQ